MNTPPSDSAGSVVRSSRQRGIAARLALIGFGAIALFFLLTEHRAHFFGVLPYLLLAACPLMHVFHHGAHRHRDDASPRPEHAPYPALTQDAPKERL